MRISTYFHSTPPPRLHASTPPLHYPIAPSPRLLVAAVGIIVLSLAMGYVSGRYSATYLPSAATAAFIVFLALIAPHSLFYVLLAGLPFSFRFFLAGKAEVQGPSEPLVAALVGAYFFDRVMSATLRKSDVPKFPRLLSLPLVIYAFATLLSVTQSPFLLESGKAAVRAAAYILFAFPVFMLLRDEAVLRRVFAVSVLSGLIAAVVMIAFLSGRLSIISHSAAYAGTLFTNYSIYGSFLSLFLLPLLARTLFDETPYDRVRHWAIFAVFAVGMLLCLSRGAWVSLLAGAGFLLMQRSRISMARKLAIVGGAVGCALVLLAIPGVMNAVLARATTVLDPNFASNRTRLLRWGAAFLMFLQHPILGGGYGAFALSYQNETFLAGENIRYQMGAHSEYLQTLAETGIVGLLAWLWVIAAFFVYGYRLVRRVEDSFWQSVVYGLMAAQVALLTHFLVGNFLNVDRMGVPFWLLFGALPAVERFASTTPHSRKGGDSARND